MVDVRNEAREMLSNLMASVPEEAVGYELSAFILTHASFPKIAASMTPDLVWLESQHVKAHYSGRYFVKHGLDSNGGSCWVMGFNGGLLSTHQARGIAVNAANAHNRAEIAKLLGGNK